MVDVIILEGKYGKIAVRIADIRAVEAGQDGIRIKLADGITTGLGVTVDGDDDVRELVEKWFNQLIVAMVEQD